MILADTCLAAIQLLQELSIWTHTRLSLAQAVHSPYGEESITDHLLVELATRSGGMLKVRSLTKDDEADYGADWDWFIGSPAMGWLRFAVQAKKLHLKVARYTSIFYPPSARKNTKRTVARGGQIDLLGACGKTWRALPIYCLYNWGDLSTEGIDCGVRPKAELGCTIASIRPIRSHCRPNYSPAFENLHVGEPTHAWHCWIPRVFHTLVAPEFAVAGDDGHWELDAWQPNRADCVQHASSEGYSFFHTEIPHSIRGLLHGDDAELIRAYGDGDSVPRAIAVLDLSPFDTRD